MDIMIYDSTGSLQGSTGWYLMILGDTVCNLVVLGQYNLVPFSIKRYWVRKVFLCQYILKSGDLVRRHRSLAHTHTQTQNIGLLSLSKSLKFKLTQEI